MPLHGHGGGRPSGDGSSCGVRTHSQCNDPSLLYATWVLPHVTCVNDAPCGAVATSPPLQSQGLPNCFRISSRAFAGSPKPQWAVGIRCHRKTRRRRVSRWGILWRETRGWLREEFFPGLIVIINLPDESFWEPSSSVVFLGKYTD